MRFIYCSYCLKIATQFFWWCGYRHIDGSIDSIYTCGYIKSCETCISKESFGSCIDLSKEEYLVAEIMSS
jgi:hypothetical protein